MLILLTHLDGDAFALDCGSVVEVLPLVDLIVMTDAPAGVAGLLNYHGALVPVVDFTMLMRGRPSVRHHSTRLVVLRTTRQGGSNLVALLAEQATELMRANPSDFAEPGIGSNALYLGGVKLDPRGTIQLVKPDAILGTDGARSSPAAA